MRPFRKSLFELRKKVLDEQYLEWALQFVFTGRDVPDLFPLDGKE